MIFGICCDCNRNKFTIFCAFQRLFEKFHNILIDARRFEFAEWFNDLRAIRHFSTQFHQQSYNDQSRHPTPCRRVPSQYDQVLHFSLSSNLLFDLRP